MSNHRIVGQEKLEVEVVEGCAGTSCMGPEGNPAICPFKANCPVYQKWLKNQKNQEEK